MKKIMILDGHSIAFRAFHAVPPLTTSNGTPTNAVLGFMNMLMKIKEQYRPNAVFAAFDLPKPTFRHLMFDGYKAGRAKTPEEMIIQVELLKDLLAKMGIHVMTAEGFEADDILGTLSAKANAEGIKAYLVTGDKDSLQLISENTSVLYTKKGVSEIAEFDEAHFMEEYGISPAQFVDCKALMGDKSDNIPGVQGIGEKTAIDLLKNYSTLDGIYENIQSISSKSVKSKLEASKESAYASRTLATIVKNAPVELPTISDEEYDIKATDELCDLLRMLEMNKLLASLRTVSFDDAGDAAEEEDTETVNADEMSGKELNEEIISSGELSVFAGDKIFWSGRTVYKTGKSADELYMLLRPSFENENVKKYLPDVKKVLHTADKLGFAVKNAAFDYSVAAYVLDAVGFRDGFDYVVRKYINFDWKKNIKYLPDLKKNMDRELEKQGMSSLYYEMEHPLITVLYEMEKEGFRVDVPMLEKLGTEYDGRIDALKEKIYSLAGCEFNINSTKQLGEVLFVKLGLPPVKKTKTGFSTDNEVLETLEERGVEIVKYIMEYRQLSKLKSTFIDGLIEAADENSRVHTTFNQTVANTGRLSSTDPNLQNIPVRTAEGAEIRRAFAATDDSYVLVDADYSQIELRVFAHLSGDENFREAFLNGEDIHRKTASQVYQVPYDQVTDEERSKTKAVNFGILYGMSDFGLAKRLSVPQNEAKAIINNYLSSYPRVDEFMKASIESARKTGMCVTLSGRQRKCPEIEAKNFAVRQAAERIAINMPVQGSAADIIKIAMIDVFNELKKSCPSSRLLLQVHDELIVEAPAEDVEKVKNILRDKMENAIKLSVPLVADIGTGRNWNEAK